MQKLFNRAWHSPTLTTWAASAGRLLMLVAVLPLVIGTFTADEVKYWFILNGLLVLNPLCDTGFAPTFVRVYAYAMGGARVDELGDQTLSKKRGEREKNWETAAIVSGACQRIYLVLAVVYFFLLGSFGTWSVVAVIPNLPNPTSGWIAWGVMAVVQPIAFLGKKYGCYLTGTNLVALNQRYTALVTLITAALMVTSLLAGGGVLTLVVVSQISALLVVAYGRFLSRRVHGGRYQDSLLGKKDSRVWDAIWPRAWKSAVGHVSLLGTTQISGIIYARGADGVSGAAYLLALRLVTTISQFADAPFYSKLPYLGRLRGEGDLERLTAAARRGMRLTLFIFVAGILGLGLFGPWVFGAIGKEVGFPPLGLWLLLGLAMFFQRYGGMHLQIFTTTNKVVWHKIAPVTGAVFLLIACTLLPALGYYAFPVGLLVSYALIYAPWSAILSYRSLPMGVWQFERTVGLPALLAILAGVAALWFLF